jgi:hypothetical protein
MSAAAINCGVDPGSTIHARLSRPSSQPGRGIMWILPGVCSVNLQG